MQAIKQNRMIKWLSVPTKHHLFTTLQLARESDLVQDKEESPVEW